MTNKYYYNWEEVDINWNEVDIFWEDVCKIIEEVTIGGAGRNPYEDELIKKQLEQLSHPKTEKLISVLIVLGNAEYKEKRKKNEHIKVKVENVKTILREVMKVEIM